jgi:hypothetical protein
MIRYYTNRDLSERLGTKLAKWKRWSREFLPPDPLGGMQSGYTRQYTPDEAFTVYLGGSLVADLHFTIPGARQILEDLQAWLSANGFRSNSGSLRKESGQHGKAPIHHYHIYITPPARQAPHPSETDGSNRSFRYLIRGILTEEPLSVNGISALTSNFIETSLPNIPMDPPSLATMKIAKMVNITTFLNDFIEELDLESADYPAFV